MKKIITALAAGIMACGCANETYYEKSVRFPEGASLEEKIDIAAHVVPTPEQLKWQSLELTAFLHFGINTFTGNEWGDGTDSPELFNPTELDCRQWARVLKENGFKMAILTAKHHDGFCLWPTATTEYSVKNSPWKNGKGDVVREMSEACAEFGLEFGVYISPWDRNAECYGDSLAYNDLYVRQITELLTNYGKISEVWFDGACAEGPNGKVQVYDWKAIHAAIRQIQPQTVTAIMGNDVRWVGNEGGLGRKTEWSVNAFGPVSEDGALEQREQLGLTEMSADMGSREVIAQAQQLYWYPSEVDVSIRPGWFYHAEQDSQVRSLNNLIDIYYQSVGRNSVLLLNIPPDRRGLLHENDVERLTEFKSALDEIFDRNLVEPLKKTWKAESSDSMVFDVNGEDMFGTFLISEDISQGQRVEGFTVEAFADGMWRLLAEGTTIGYRRLLRFEKTAAEQIRVTITSTRATANISAVGLY